MMRRRAGTQGYVLITVLWMGLGLLLAVSAYLSTSRQEALGVRAEVARARAVELARSGVNVALADLGRVNQNQTVTPRDGTPVTLRMAEGEVTYRIIDEAGKVDILSAPASLLAPVLLNIGESQNLGAFDAVNVAQSLAGFVAQSRDTSGSVYAAMEAAGLGGQTAVIASRYLTTLNFTSKVNPRTAPREVLEAIPGMGVSDVDEIMIRRATGDQMPRLGSSTSWLVERSGPVYTVEAESILATGGRATVQAQVAQIGLSFRGSIMQYAVISYRIVR